MVTGLRFCPANQRSDLTIFYRGGGDCHEEKLSSGLDTLHQRGDLHHDWPHA